MAKPIVVDIPHKLGRAEARRRIADGTAKLAGKLPGAAEVRHEWKGDRLDLAVSTMGQTVTSAIEVFDDRVHAEIHLPLFLALFGDAIRGRIERDGPTLLA